jgi:hypothetical protein
VCSFNDNGTYQVNVRVKDDDGGETTASTLVTVNNVVPTVTAPGNQSGNEGTPQSFALGTFSDPEPITRGPSM